MAKLGLAAVHAISRPATVGGRIRYRSVAGLEARPDQPDLAPEPTGTAGEPSSKFPVTWLWLLPPLALTALGYHLLAGSHQSGIGGLGLINALPIAYFVVVLALVGSFFAALRQSVSGFILTVHILAVVLLVPGSATIVETVPRFATAWLHAGFTNQILEHHHTLPTLDARFSWPGFFAAAAALTGAAGLSSAVALIKWAPVVFVSASLLPVFVIARHLTRSRSQAWTSLILFVFIDWVGQEYFAPQSLGFLLYLMAIAILVCVFRSDRFSAPSRVLAWAHGRFPRLSRLRRARGLDGCPDALEAPGARVIAVCVLVMIAIAEAVSHQLSPVMLILATLSLVVFRRTSLTFFPVIAGLITVGWISLGAVAFWTGHLSTIFGGVGHVGTVVGSTVDKRVGGNAGHLFVLQTRFALSGAAWCAALAAYLLLWRARRAPVTLGVLAAAPGVLILGQSYGGEGLLRVFLFSSPFTAILAANLLHMAARRLAGTVVVAAALVVLLPAFLIARFGNEQFESFTPQEVSAVSELYAIAAPGSVLVSVTPDVPWRYNDIGDYTYRSDNLDTFAAGNLAAIDTLLAGSKTKAKTSYLIVSRAQLASAEVSNGLPNGWFGSVREELTPAAGFDVVYSNADAVIYRYSSKGSR